MTGMHSVSDIFCKVCNSTVGWKYVISHFVSHCGLLASFFFRSHPDCFCSHLQEKAHEESQKYKEGKYILEKAKVVKENGWEVD